MELQERWYPQLNERPGLIEWGSGKGSCTGTIGRYLSTGGLARPTSSDIASRRVALVPTL